MGWNGPFAPNMGGFGGGWRELAFLGGGLGGLGGFGFAPFHFMEFVERPVPCVPCPEGYDDDFITINDYYYDVCRYDHPEPPVIDEYGNEIYFELPAVHPYRNGRPSGPLVTDESRRGDRNNRGRGSRGGRDRDDRRGDRNDRRDDRDDRRDDRDDRRDRDRDDDRDRRDRRRALLLK